jgi:hypothetical protein
LLLTSPLNRRLSWVTTKLSDDTNPDQPVAATPHFPLMPLLSLQRALVSDTQTVLIALLPPTLTVREESPSRVDAVAPNTVTLTAPVLPPFLVTTELNTMWSCDPARDRVDAALPTMPQPVTDAYTHVPLPAVRFPVRLEWDTHWLTSTPVPPDRPLLVTSDENPIPKPTTVQLVAPVVAVLLLRMLEGVTASKENALVTDATTPHPVTASPMLRKAPLPSFTRMIVSERQKACSDADPPFPLRIPNDSCPCSCAP